MAIVTYTSPDVSVGVQPKGLRVGLIATSATYSFAAVSYTAGDIIQMVKVPANAAVVGMILSTNTGLAGSVIVGDGVDTDRYIQAYALSLSAAATGLNGINYVPYVYSTDDTIDLTMSMSASGSIGIGSITLTVIYSMDVIT